MFTWEGEHPAVQAGLSLTVWREATNQLQETLKRSPNPDSEGRDAPVLGAFAVSCPCCYGQNGGSLVLLLLLLLSHFNRVHTLLI